MKRGKEPADKLGNNPETGCRWVAHHDSLIGNGGGFSGGHDNGGSSGGGHHSSSDSGHHSGHHDGGAAQYSGDPLSSSDMRSYGTRGTGVGRGQLGCAIALVIFFAVIAILLVVFVSSLTPAYPQPQP